MLWLIIIVCLIGFLGWSVIRSGEDKTLNLTDKPIIEEHEKIFSDN